MYPVNREAVNAMKMIITVKVMGEVAQRREIVKAEKIVSRIKWSMGQWRGSHN